MHWQPESPKEAPEGFDRDLFFAPHRWHQRWEIFHGIFTPGINSVDQICDFIGLPKDLRGLRVLDIGAWNGCFSFECERRGALEVVALSLENSRQSGFLRIREAIGSRVVKYEQSSVYDISPDRLGSFDIVLFLGVLYHLRYPLLAIDKIRPLCEGTVFVETHVIDNHFVVRHENGTSVSTLDKCSEKLTAIPLWRFYKDDELNKGDRSNWFGPNVRGVIEGFETAGFETRLITTWGDRGAFQAISKKPLAESLEKTYEGEAPMNQKWIGIRSCKKNPTFAEE
jgi:tRNA (mo5U34)-methyltransferase